MTEPRRRSLSRPERVAIAERDRWICGRPNFYTGDGCGQLVAANSNWQIDHIVPWALTHDDSPENLQLLCWECHQRKTSEVDRPAISKGNRQRDKHDAHVEARKRGERRQSKLEQRRAKLRDSQPASTRQTTEIDEC